MLNSNNTEIEVVYTENMLKTENMAGYHLWCITDKNLRKNSAENYIENKAKFNVETRLTCSNYVLDWRCVSDAKSIS